MESKWWHLDTIASVSANAIEPSLEEGGLLLDVRKESEFTANHVVGGKRTARLLDRSFYGRFIPKQYNLCALCGRLSVGYRM